MNTIELISKTKLCVTEKYMQEICKREIKKMTLDEIKYIKEELSYNLDHDTIYLVDNGLIIYIANDGFNLYYFEENIDGFICKPLHELYKENKLGNKNINKDSISCNNDNNIDKYNIDFEENCWECGSLLDDDGNCSVCGCSKEIF